MTHAEHHDLAVQALDFFNGSLMGEQKLKFFRFYRSLDQTQADRVIRLQCSNDPEALHRFSRERQTALMCDRFNRNPDGTFRTPGQKGEFMAPALRAIYLV